MILVFLLAARLGTAQVTPPVPELALDTFPPAARAGVSRVLQTATKRPNDAAAVGTLGRWLQAWEQWDASHQAYVRAQALAPGEFDWIYLDAIVLQRLARHREAVARLMQAVAVKSDYLPARVRLAEATLDAGDLADARRGFTMLLKEPAAEPAAHVGLGRIAAIEGRHTEAVEHFERAVALFPELGAAYYGLARSYRVIGRADDAARALQQHSRFGPRWPRVDDAVLDAVNGLRDDPRAVLTRGIARAEAGDVEAAIADHEAALSGDPTLVNAHANLLSLYGRMKNWPKAEEHYRAAVAAGFSSADLNYDYGIVAALQGNLTEAEDAYRRALAVNPMHAQARNNLGQLLERRDPAAAADEYRRALEAQPAFRLARFNLGRMLLGLKKPAEAGLEFEKLQEARDSDSPRYLFALATARVLAGRREEGIRLAKEAQQLAMEYGQDELASAIGRELAGLK